MFEGAAAAGRFSAWRTALLVGVGLAVLLGLTHPAHAHGEAVEVVVEALSRGGDDLGTIDYGIAITFVDGDQVTGAEVEISVSPDADAVVEPVEETVAGVYIGRIRLPGEGEARVTVAFDSPDTSGSVEFTQRVSDPVPEAPVVMVDTLNPDRVGTLAQDATSILGSGDGEVQIGEHSSPVIVEAFVATATEPLMVEYAAVVEGSEDASITLTAESDDGDVVGPMTLSESNGVHRTIVDYPSSALWTVSLALDTATSQETVTFPENLPWPHYTTEAGQPKVKYDSDNPDRVGTIAAEDASVYFRQESSENGEVPATTAQAGSGAAPATTEASPRETAPQDEVVVDVTEPAEEIRVDVALRVLHIAALGLWVVPMIASALGREHRLSVPAALTGMTLTAGSGVLLALWGAPVTFPGILRWEDLATRLYGDAYLIAFLAKMGVALVAFVGSIVWAARRSRFAVFVTFAALGSALVAVTIMGQLHLFSHL